MKTLTNVLKKVSMLILALLLLSSCYDIVFISQDKDVQTNQLFKTKVCVHVSNYYYSSVPYFGVMLPYDWAIKSQFDYVQEYNGLSMKLGEMVYSKKMTFEMDKIDPAPDGYKWWVGIGTNEIPTNVKGVICTSPVMKTGNNIGNHALDYMIGDNINGLNVVRSGKKAMRVIDKWTPQKLVSKLDGQSVVLKWKKPGVNNGVKGYNIYRDGVKLNHGLSKECQFIDNKPATNSYKYEITAVKANGTEGALSVPANVCYCPSGPSIQFNGNGEKAMIFDAPLLNPISQLTIESWIRFKKGGSLQPFIVSKSGNTLGYELYLSGLGFERDVCFKIEPGYLKSNTHLKANIWYHVAATYDGKSMRLYINGKLDSELYAKGHLGISHEPVLIGKRNVDSFDKYTGNIDEVRIWNISRTAKQIEKYQRLLLNGKEEGLVGYWRMDDGCNYYGCDMSGNGNEVYLMNKTCWCSSTFPFIPDLKESSSNITVPVVNHYFPNEPIETIILMFEFNPKLLAYEGLDLYETQMKKMKIKTHVSPYGRLIVVAKTEGHFITSTDNLIKIKFRALQPNLYDVLDFIRADFNDVPIRTMSGNVKVVLTPDHKSVSGLDEKSTAAKDVSVTMYPNPVKSNATFTYDLDEEAFVELSVYSLTGQKVSTVISRHQNAGAQRAEFDATNLTPGVYVYVLQANNSKFTGKMIIKD